FQKPCVAWLSQHSRSYLLVAKLLENFGPYLAWRFHLPSLPPLGISHILLDLALNSLKVYQANLHHSLQSYAVPSHAPYEQHVWPEQQVLLFVQSILHHRGVPPNNFPTSPTLPEILRR